MTLQAHTVFSADLLRSDTLRRIVGSFWSELYADQAAMSAMLWVSQQLARQYYREMREALDSSHPRLTPLLHTQTFYKVQVAAKDIAAVPFVYGDSSIYGDFTSPFSYGDYRSGGWRMPLATDVKSAAGVANGTVRPSKFFVDGRDCSLTFTGDTPSLTIADHPDDVFTSTDVGGEKFYDVWLYMAGFEVQSLAKRHGRVFNLTGESSEYLRQAIIACREASRHTPSELQLRRLLGAAIREDVVEQRQTVKRIDAVNGKYVVVLDSQRIVGAPGKQPVCSVGDTVLPGDFVFDTVELITFDQPVPPELPGIWFPPRLTRLGQHYFLPNADVTLSRSVVPASLTPTDAAVDPRLSEWLAGSDDAIHKSLLLTDPQNAYAGGVANVLAALASTTLRSSTCLAILREEFVDQAAIQVLRQASTVLPPNVSIIFQSREGTALAWDA